MTDRCERGVLHEPEQPTVKRLAEKLDGPPWMIDAPDFGGLPEEATDLVVAIKWRGRWFLREGFTR